MGLGIRDSQDKLKQLKDEQKREQTVRQSRKLTDQRNAVRRRLRAYQDLQPIYMPGLLQHLTDTAQSEDTMDSDPESVKLWLPSELPEDLIDRLCVSGLRRVEGQLQRARCFNSLHGVRHTLRVKTRMVLFKNRNVRGQRASGKSREIINRVVRRAKWYASRYRVARSAYLKLMGPGDWEMVLRPLRSEDVRSYRDPASLKVGPGRKGNDEDDQGEVERLRIFREIVAREEKDKDEGQEEEEEEEEWENEETTLGDLDLIPPDRQQWEHRSKHGTGETRKDLSWIWTAGGKIDIEDGADENENEILRVEWCKSRARARRAIEEVALVQEEMRRTLAFLEWRAIQWEECTEIDFDLRSTEREGYTAYALSQASVQRSLKARFQLEWQMPLEKVEEIECSEDQDHTDMPDEEVDDYEDDLDDVDGGNGENTDLSDDSPSRK
ncbi:hypothetical protein VNI00_018212 [Paramarasmius palmivorus]|uniref:Uncharacterized protein n=1 Tax=Paramarasmius palmivorus TaxID=297713 RepID=A0AAW0AZH1_9AGAR